MKLSVLLPILPLILAGEALAVVTVYDQTFVDGDDSSNSQPALNGTTVPGGTNAGATWSAWSGASNQWTTQGATAFGGTNGTGSRNAILPFNTTIAGTSNKVFTLTVDFSGFSATGTSTSNEQFRMGFSTSGSNTADFDLVGVAWLAVSSNGTDLSYELYTAGTNSIASGSLTSQDAGIFSIQLDTREANWVVTFSEDSNFLGGSAFTGGAALTSVGMGIARPAAGQAFSADVATFSLSAEVPETSGALVGLLFVGAGFLRRR